MISSIKEVIEDGRVNQWYHVNDKRFGKLNILFTALPDDVDCIDASLPVFSGTNNSQRNKEVLEDAIKYAVANEEIVYFYKPNWGMYEIKVDVLETP